MKHAIIALTLLVASALGAAAFVTGASAHADYESSTPGAGEVVATAPASLIVNFTGEMQKLPGTYVLTVTGPDGAGATAGAPVVSANGRTMTVALMPGLPNGTYTVSWLTTGAEDGHERSGTFTFSIGAPGAPAPMPTAMPVDDDHDHSDPDDHADASEHADLPMDHGSMNHGMMDHDGMDHAAMMDEGPVLTGLVVVHLDEQNGSGVDGRAEILPVDGGMKSQVGVYVNGVQPGSMQMGMIHLQETCGSRLGAHDADLEDLTADGTPHSSSLTVLDDPFDELFDGKHAIVIHASDKSVIACGVIPDQPRGAATITLPSAGSGTAAAGGVSSLLLGIAALGLASVSAGAFALAWRRAQ